MINCNYIYDFFGNLVGDLVYGLVCDLVCDPVCRIISDYVCDSACSLVPVFRPNNFINSSYRLFSPKFPPIKVILFLPLVLLLGFFLPTFHPYIGTSSTPCFSPKFRPNNGIFLPLFRPNYFIDFVKK